MGLIWWGESRGHRSTLNMLKQLLLLSLLGLSQGFRLTQGFTPLVTNLYSPYIPVQQQSLTTSYAITSSAKPLRFWQSLCMVSQRDMASLFDGFDMDKNGLISQNEIAAASLCSSSLDTRKRKAPVSQYLAETEPNCDWLNGASGPSQIYHYIYWRAVSVGSQGVFASIYKLDGQFLDLFHATDINNDNCLDMNEFWNFGSHLWDSIEFYIRSTSNPDDEEDPLGDRISQLELNCFGQDISECNPNEGQQILLSEMPNMDGDPNSLNLAEFKSAIHDWRLKAKNSPYFEGYCKNWALPPLESFYGTDGEEPPIPINLRKVNIWGNPAQPVPQ